LAPRLSLGYDLRGDGRWHIDGTYSWYAGKYNDVQFGRISSVANPKVTLRVYQGPDGSGRNFAPGFDLANYTPPTTDPAFGRGVGLANGLSSPLAVEWTLGVAHTFGHGAARALYVHRGLRDFIEDFVDHRTGETELTDPRGRVTGRAFTNTLYENTNAPTRVYEALVIASDLYLPPHFQVSASYTRQLRNDGDFEGEATNAPGLSSIFGNYPELRVPQNNPPGHLKSFQRHKLRVYGTYGVKRLELGLLYRYNSPRTYSLVLQNVLPSSIQVARDPTYPNTSGGGQDLFFGPRGSESFEAEHLFDLSASYSVPLHGRLRPYVKAELRNVLNAHPLIAAETRLAGPSGAFSTWTFDADGLPATYQRVAGFGEARSASDYPTPRTFQLAIGVRF
jgi:hypothetical protein